MLLICVYASDEKEGLGGHAISNIAPNSAILCKNVQKFEIFENTACKKLQEDDLSSNQEGSSPLLSQLSSTVVRQLLDLKGKEKRSTVGSKKREKKSIVRSKKMLKNEEEKNRKSKELTFAERNVWMTKTSGCKENYQ